MTDTTLTVYVADKTTPDVPPCVQCKTTEQAITKLQNSYPGLTAKYIEVLQSDDDTRNFLKEKYGFSQFPIVVNNQDESDVWAGFRPDRIKNVAKSLAE